MSDQRKIRNGILGFGSRGVSFVAPILNNDINNVITTVVDPDVSRSKYFMDEAVKKGLIPKDEAENVRFVADIDDLEEEEIDALWLTASEKVRTMVFEKAVQYGAHIYMEKGLSDSMEGAAKIIDAMKHKKTGQTIFMGFNLRHFPAIVQAKRMIDDGRVGDILFLQYTEMMDFQHGGSFFMRFHRDVANSGGMLVTKACHDFDLIGHFLGARPERVFSAQYKRMFGKGGPNAREQCHTCDRTESCDWERMRRQPGRAAKRKYAKIYLDDDKVTTDGYHLDLCCWRDDTKLKDLSNVMFEYDNGIPATYTQLLFAPQGNRIIKIFGTDGSMVVEERDRSVTIVDRWNTRTERIVANPVPGGHGGSDAGVTDAFFKAIRSDDEPDSSIDDGVWALAAATAAYESNDSGTWVDVKPIVDREIS